jgi:hypothetical protein
MLEKGGQVGRIDLLNQSVPYLERHAVTANEGVGFRRRSSWAAIALLVAAWCMQMVRYFDYDFLPLYSAIAAACLAVLITFGSSWLLAYAVWVGLLHRKSARLVSAAAALSLSWCAAGLLFPVLRSFPWGPGRFCQ